MITAVLIDDEKDANSVLSSLLNNFTTKVVKILGTADNLDDGIKLINDSKPDVVFLDIQMPGRNGLEIFNHFPNPEFKLVIVTAYSQYAIDAIKKSATDYILKPVSFMELQETLSRISRMLESEKQQYEMEDKIGFINSPEIQGVRIVFDVETGFMLIDTRIIEYCFADQSYSVIVTNTGKHIVISKPLKELQEMLPVKHFYRTHKSYLVNVYYIRKFVRASESFVYLKSGNKIPVSVRNTTKIKNDIKQMLSI